MKTEWKTPALLLIVVLLSACSPAGPGGGKTESPGEGASMIDPQALSGPPGLEELATSTITVLMDAQVTLAEGQWEGDPYEEGGSSRPSVQLIRDLHLTGDLDGDGASESVVLLAESSGGSGTRLHLMAAGRSGGKATDLGTALIGDRVQVKSARIAEGRIEVEVIQAGAEDAMCCPSEKALRRWALGPRGLEELEREMTGKRSVEDLAGTEWRLTHWDRKEPAPAEPEVTLSYQEGQIGGSDGCNRYFAAVADGEMPGDLEMGPAGTTRMACPPEQMEVETRFLEALASARSYSFLAGKLAIGYESGDSLRTLLFEPR